MDGPHSLLYPLQDGLVSLQDLEANEGRSSGMPSWQGCLTPRSYPPNTKIESPPQGPLAPSTRHKQTQRNPQTGHTTPEE